uniref:Cytochrome c oxidase subunit 3 n=1 Tax=Sceliphron madraspatanum TaxID=2008740 RepID=A0A343DRF8_9HYME|nr:cytochrome c oxidase subunit 3 [Sceliphron madraspatanum]
MMKTNHPFHMVTPSPWPLLTSISIMNQAIGMINWFHNNNYLLIMISSMFTSLCLFQWWRDVIRESLYQGCHTLIVQKNIRMGMMLFILSELFFFVSFFWAYFHMALSPSIEIGSMWPPKGIKMFNPYKIPLLNTMILVSSGFSITWCHYSIINNNFKESKLSLIITIMLGWIFTMIQIYEYYQAPFTISDSVFGSIFFMSTGFHGIHVIIGNMFLSINLFRLTKFHFSKTHHLGFELASWYWHFVDVIWLFLYMCIYWWIY